MIALANLAFWLLVCWALWRIQRRKRAAEVQEAFLAGFATGSQAVWEAIEAIQQEERESAQASATDDGVRVAEIDADYVRAQLWAARRGLQ